MSIKGLLIQETDLAERKEFSAQVVNYMKYLQKHNESKLQGENFFIRNDSIIIISEMQKACEGKNIFLVFTIYLIHIFLFYP